VGNLAAAEAALARLDASHAASPTPAQAAEVAIHGGLVLLARADLPAARAAFERALAACPGSCVAANNRAVCCLHMCALGEAIGGLEAFVKAEPARRLSAAVVGTLASLYELQESDAVTSRRALDALVAAVGADNLSFELAAQQRPAAAALTAAP
jgi:hypothetical protein